MIFELKKEDKIYIIDDLKLFNQQSKAFQEAFNETEKENATGIIKASFDNADAVLYINSNRVIVSLKNIDNENN